MYPWFEERRGRGRKEKEKRRLVKVHALGQRESTVVPYIGGELNRGTGGGGSEMTFLIPRRNSRSRHT